MGSGNELDQDWSVDGSDDEKYNPSKIPGVGWQPNPNDILEMFDKLSQDKAVLELKWQCPSRRSPEPEKQNEEDLEEQEQEDDQEEEVEEEVKAPEPSAFDFDDFGTEASGNITPRRMPGSGKTPRSQKRVARMDKVLDDIRRQHLERAALKEARRGASRSPGSPANVRFRLGMTGSPGMTRSDIIATPPHPLSGDVGMVKQTTPGTLTRDSGENVGGGDSPFPAKLKTGHSPKPATPSNGTPTHSPAPLTAGNRQSPGVQQTTLPSPDAGSKPVS